jgi:quercetin dioxygenase-like cupin family protein
MKAYLLRELVGFSDGGPEKNVFFESGKIKAQVMGLKKGQTIPPCRMDFDVIFVVIEGEGKIIVDGEEAVLKKTSWVYVPKERETRSIQAHAKMTILAIQIRC